MSSKQEAVRSLRQAGNDLDAAIAALVHMRAGAVDLCGNRLAHAASVLAAVVRSGIGSGEKPALRQLVTDFRLRIVSLERLMGGVHSFCSGRPGWAPSITSLGYTADGELNTLAAEASMTFET